MFHQAEEEYVAVHLKLEETNQDKVKDHFVCAVVLIILQDCADNLDLYHWLMGTLYSRLITNIQSLQWSTVYEFSRHYFIFMQVKHPLRIKIKLSKLIYWIQYIFFYQTAFATVYSDSGSTRRQTNL